MSLPDRLAVLPQYLLPKQALTSLAGALARDGFRGEAAALDGAGVRLHRDLGAGIDRDDVVRRLEAPFGMLSEAVDVSILEPPVTLSRLRERLMSQGGFHLLHFFGHGVNRRGVSALVSVVGAEPVDPAAPAQLHDTLLR